ncbi:hypothetical protein ACHAWF_004460 [Thalassiosira exigua]
MNASPRIPFDVCESLEEMIQMAHDNIETLSHSDYAAFWTIVPELIQSRDQRLAEKNFSALDKLRAILVHTLDGIDACSPRYLTQTTLALAKIIANIENQQGRRIPKNSPHRILHDVLVGSHSHRKKVIFEELVAASMLILHEFDERSLSNLIYAFGLAKYVHVFDDGDTNNFDRLALEVVPRLENFTAQGMSNLIWAYATAKEANKELFNAMATHIVQLDNLTTFDPQALSNIVWAYATAGESHPQLFKKVANHIAGLDSLRSFNPQALCNIVWAYATVSESHRRLFKKIADHIVQLDIVGAFGPQELSNTVWAYATIGHLELHLFKEIAPNATALLTKCNGQELANLAWAYAVANVPSPSLFKNKFVNACLKKENEFNNFEHLSQLHQWNLWQREMKSNVRLPPSLERKCHDAFVSRAPTRSPFQHDVVSALLEIGLNPKEEVLTKSGYRLDALVEVNGNKIGIEVDGPYHFVDRRPTGKMILKHRQVTKLDELPVTSVPYWEWNKVKKDRGKKQQYLRSLLGLRRHHRVNA